MVNRAAVVVGIDRTGGLTPLRAAASGARSVEAWLRGDGYEVLCLTDETESVAVSQVKQAVKEYVALGTVRQLVIYFAGHGYLNDTAEIWLLSGAPDDPDEAIDLTFSGELARSCGIPSVTFVSDACRSNPPSIRGARVGGSSIFPNRSESMVDVEVDRFFAARPGDPALELPLDEASKAYVGLFTDTLTRAHLDPAPSLQRTVLFDGRPYIVVPSRGLKKILPERVNEAAQDRSLKLTQLPQLRLEGGEDSFLAKATFTSPPTLEGMWRGSQVVSRDPGGQAAFSLPTAKDLQGLLAPNGPSVNTTGFQTQVAAILQGDIASRNGFERLSERGEGQAHEGSISITGSTLARAYAVGDEVTRIDPDRDGAGFESSPAEVNYFMLRFGDGNGTVVAKVPGCSVSVFVEDGRVVSVSHSRTDLAPFTASSRRSLHAIAATAARAGLLASDRDQARQFARDVRDAAPLDPTLALYAALALADLGLSREVPEIARRINEATGVHLCDLEILGRAVGRNGHGDQNAQSDRVVLGCPMLSRTWTFLRAKGLDLSRPFIEAGHHRISSLWTTFDPGGMDILERAVGGDGK